MEASAGGAASGAAAGAQVAGPWGALAGGIIGAFGGGGGGSAPGDMSSVSLRDFVAPISFGDYFGGSPVVGSGANAGFSGLQLAIGGAVALVVAGVMRKMRRKRGQ